MGTVLPCTVTVSWPGADSSKVFVDGVAALTVVVVPAAVPCTLTVPVTVKNSFWKPEVLTNAGEEGTLEVKPVGVRVYARGGVAAGLWSLTIRVLLAALALSVSGPTTP